MHREAPGGTGRHRAAEPRALPGARPQPPAAITRMTLPCAAPRSPLLTARRAGPMGEAAAVGWTNRRARGCQRSQSQAEAGAAGRACGRWGYAEAPWGP